MKKFLLIAVMFFGFTIAHAADTTNVVTQTVQSVKDATTKVDTSSLSKQIYSDFKSGITSAAAALKVGVEHVYRILVKQQVVKSIVYIAICLIIGCFSIVFYKRMRYNNDEYLKFRDNDKTKNWNSDRTDNSFGIASIIYSILFVGSVLATVTTLYVNIEVITTGFINPEYGAMRDIVSFAR